MIIYILVATVLFYVAYIAKGLRYQKKAYLCLSIMLVLFDGLRWESGTDWGNYYQYFTTCLMGDNSHFEVGYQTINRVVRSLTSSYTIFLLILAVALYTCLGLFFKKNSVAPILSLALFFALFVSYQGMNRQFIAICFCLIAYNCLEDKMNICFIILVLIGSIFHITAFLFLLGLLIKKQLKNSTYILVVFASIVLGNMGLVKTIIDLGIDSLGPRVSLLLDFYSQQDLTSQSLIGMLFAYIRRLIILVPMLFYMKNNKLSMPMVLAFNYYFMGFIVYIMFNGTVLQVMVARGNIYFMIFECLLIPYLMYIYRKKLGRGLFFLLVYFGAIGNMVKGIQFYDVLGKGQNPFIPYKSLYYNTDIQKNTK